MLRCQFHLLPLSMSRLRACIKWVKTWLWRWLWRRYPQTVAGCRIYEYGVLPGEEPFVGSVECSGYVQKAMKGDTVREGLGPVMEEILGVFDRLDLIYF